MTEIALQEIKFDADIKTSITLNNESVLNDLVSQVESKYSNLIYTNDNEKEAKQDRAELNKVVKKIDDERKKVKREYNVPLKEFEDKMKSYSNRIDKVIFPIDEGIKELEARQRNERLAEVEGYILEVAKNYEIEANEIEIDPKWLNKSISKIQRERLITDAMTFLKQKKDNDANEKTIVVAYAKALQVDETGWLLQLEQGKTSAEIMKMIDTSIQQKKERDEREKQEELRIVELQKEREKQKELNVIEQRKEVVVADEQIELEIIPEFEKFVVELETITLRFTATSEQLDILSKFILENEITAEKL